MIRRKHNQAFTLIEALIASVLVGFAIAALVSANASFSMANGAGANLSTAEFLIEQIREMTAMMAVDDLGTLAAQSPFSPPVDASQTVLTNFPTYAQQVTVDNVSAQDFDTVVGSSDFFRITVTISNNGIQVSQASWIRARY
jgi:type II secretory pathway pseudopilin PulG